MSCASRRRSRPNGRGAHGGPGPAQATDAIPAPSASACNAIQAAVLALRQRQRELLLLHVDGLTYRQIASRNGLPDGSRPARARRSVLQSARGRCPAVGSRRALEFALRCRSASHEGRNVHAGERDEADRPVQPYREGGLVHRDFRHGGHRSRDRRLRRPGRVQPGAADPALLPLDARRRRLGPRPRPARQRVPQERQPTSRR